MKRHIFLAFIMLVVNLFSWSKMVHGQQSILLPADFVFQTQGVDHVWFLVKVNAQTGQWNLFYAKKGVDVFLIKWSPKGKYLAIFQSGYLCVLTRDGKLVSCSDNQVGAISTSGNGAGGNGYIYTVAWSNDESKLFYITDMPIGGGNATLIESDVMTGKTLSILYNQPDMDPWTAIPANNRAALLLRTGGGNRIADTVNYIRFQSSINQSNINNTVVRKNLNMHFSPPSGYDLTLPQNQQDNPQDHISGFCPFSPQGTYLTAFDNGDYSLYDPHAYEWDILDINGDIVYKMTPDHYTPLEIPGDCVAWSPNEKTFYSRQRVRGQYADYIVIHKYLLKGNNQVDIVPYFTQANVLDPYMSPWEVSPDGNYLLYEEACGQDDGCDLATVVGPNNTVERYPGINGISAHPLWVPPLQP